MGSCCSLQRALDRGICPGRWAIRGREASKDVPSDAVNFWYFSWFEDGVGDAAKGCADVEGDDEGAGWPCIGFAHV